MKKFLLFGIMAILFSSCAEMKTFFNNLFNKQVEITNEMSTMQDERDQKTYEIVKIGNQWWMAENLNYETEEGSYFYKDHPSKGDFYGRLYTHESALKACPKGWKLPSDEEWMTLEKELGIIERQLEETGFRGTDQGEQLKIHKGASGFNAILAGWRDIEGNYNELDEVAIFWTATKQSKNYVWVRALSKGIPKINRRSMGRTLGLSVRCIKE